MNIDCFEGQVKTNGVIVFNKKISCCSDFRDYEEVLSSGGMEDKNSDNKFTKYPIMDDNLFMLHDVNYSYADINDGKDIPTLRVVHNYSRQAQIFHYVFYDM